MTLRRPRRIFRASHRPGRGGPSAAQAIVAGLLGIVIGATAILLMLPGDLFGRVPSPDGTLQAEPQDVAVVDGQTLTLGLTSVRLLGVAAPARGEACGGAATTDCGASAARALASIVRGHPLTCRLQGRDGRGFAQASCLAGDTDVNRAIVLAGWARARDGAEGDAGAESPLAGAERAARAARRGLWTEAPRPAS